MNRTRTVVTNRTPRSRLPCYPADAGRGGEGRPPRGPERAGSEIELEKVYPGSFFVDVKKSSPLREKDPWSAQKRAKWWLQAFLSGIPQVAVAYENRSDCIRHVELFNLKDETLIPEEMKRKILQLVERVLRYIRQICRAAD